MSRLALIAARAAARGLPQPDGLATPMGRLFSDARPRSDGKRRGRGVTVVSEPLSAAEKAEARRTAHLPSEPLPESRGECAGGPRPCPLVRCQYHLYLDVNPETGAMKVNFPKADPWEIPHSCALDVADMGGVTLEDVGRLINLTRERVRQVETRGLSMLRGRIAALDHRGGRRADEGGDLPDGW